MSTTRCTTARDARPLPPVVALRPRSLSRRAGILQARLRDRRAAGLPHEEVLLDVVDGVLARTSDVRADDLDVWARLVALVEEHDDLSPTLPACAATANLVGLALFGDVEDHAALCGLADELGHRRLAGLQHRYGSALETDSRLPLTTAAMRRLLGPGLGRRLATHPRTTARSEAVDDASLRAAHALLVQGIDRAWTVPPLDSVEEFVDIAANGTVNEWRHHVAMIITDPWSPYARRVVELARQVGTSHPAVVVTALVALCREQPLDERPGLARPVSRRTRYPSGRAAP